MLVLVIYDFYCRLIFFKLIFGFVFFYFATQNRGATVYTQSGSYFFYLFMISSSKQFSYVANIYVPPDSIQRNSSLNVIML